MVQKAHGRYEVTLAMALKRSKSKASERCAREHLRKRGIKFRKMREKPLLTKADVKERLAFAKKFCNTSLHDKVEHFVMDVSRCGCLTDTPVNSGFGCKAAS